jgi:hypothetical protein
MVWADNLQYAPDIRSTESPVLWMRESAETFKEVYKSQIESGFERFAVRCAAPTAEEILKELPVLIRIGDNIAGLQAWLSTSSDFAFYVGWQRYHPYREKEDPWHGADKASEAAALAYLWWKEQK